jgi:hypothetical protein
MYALRFSVYIHICRSIAFLLAQMDEETDPCLGNLLQSGAQFLFVFDYSVVFKPSVPRRAARATYSAGLLSKSDERTVRYVRTYTILTYLSKIHSCAQRL